MATGYAALTAPEQTTYNECARLHQLEDWAEFTDSQSARLAAADEWIRERRRYIYDCAEGNVANGNGPGWDTCDRRARYDYLHTCQMGGAPNALCQLPTSAAMDEEGVLISEREMWWRNPKGQYAEQSARRQACTDELIARRKYVWNLAEGNVAGATPGWDQANREQRYYNLQVATKAGSGYEDWAASHDTTTGEPKSASGGGGGGSSGGTSREKALSWMASHRGLYEDPDGSNCDSRSDGIRKAQDDCVKMGSSGTWLRNEPWCGVWCANAMEAAGVAGLSYNLASVAWIEDRAKAGGAPFTGWTTNGDNADPGDLVIIGSYGGHVGMLRAVYSGSCDVDEGNTSDTSALRNRSRSGEIRGYAKVRYP
jgi:hypothetical protein